MAAKAQQKKATQDVAEKYFWHYAFGVLFITFIVLFKVLSADFLNWDDPTFVLGNADITSFSGKNISHMFSSFVMGNYCPLTILSYALDYNFAGGLFPKMFHISALLIHLINTLLVFVFIYHLSKKQVIIAAIAALLFGIHPMHLESVAWVAERRDVLYAMFYLCGLVMYTRYLENNYSVKYLLYTLLFFVCSLLSKGQAVTFPLVLLITDYIYTRKFDRKAILEKIPFFTLSLVFGLIAIVAQKTTPAVNVFHLSTFDSLFIGNYGLLLYIVKVFFPFTLSGYHPYPFTASTNIPMIIYIAPLIIIGLMALVFMKLKKDRDIVGGLLIFLFTIFPVLQFLPVGETIISERYTYVPYIGLFFVIGHAYRYADRYSLLRGIKSSAPYILAVYFVIIGAITWGRTRVWKDSVSFWTDVIANYPNNKIPYNNRGYMYNEFKQFDLALKDFNRGIALDSTYGRLYLNRGLAYERKQMHELALADYTTSIRLDTTEPQTFLNRGSMYTDLLGKYDLGIQDFKRVLRINPENTAAMNNMGVAYFKKGEYDSSIAQYNSSLEKNPKDGKIYYFRALVYAAKKEFDKAIADANTARQLGHTVEDAVLQEWERLKTAP